MDRQAYELMTVIWCAHTGMSPDVYTPDYVRSWIALCEELGISTVLWRGSYVGKATYHSKVLPVMTHLSPDFFEKQGLDRERWEPTRRSFNGMAEAMERFDGLDMALEEAKKRGIAFYADLSLFDMYFGGLESDFFDEHPQYWLLARDQRARYRGIPCYAEPGAQEYRLAEVRELLDRGVDGFSFYLESHASLHGQVIGADPTEGIIEPDSFGFNPPVVDAYRARYGVDILQESFDPQKLHQLNGDFLTAFLRRVREVIGPNRKLLGTTPVDGKWGYGGPAGRQLAFRRLEDEPIEGSPCYQLDLQWQRWIEEGIVDGLLVHAPLPNAVQCVRSSVKDRVPEGRVLLKRKPFRDPDSLPVYKGEVEAIRRGALDGYVFDEFAALRPDDSQWRGLFV